MKRAVLDVQAMSKRGYGFSLQTRQQPHAGDRLTAFGLQRCQWYDQAVTTGVNSLHLCFTLPTQLFQRR